MLSRHSLGHVPALAVLLALAAMPSASAQSFTITFENATAIPNNPSPSPLNASYTFKDAFGGTDTVQGVTFDDTFIVYRNSYTNNVGGNNLYGSTHGTFALANTAGGGTADTGPGDPGLDGVTFTTNAVLTSAYFGSVDYGGGTFGADSVTVTPFGSSGDLGPGITLNLTTSLGTPLAKMDTSAFSAYAGNITGYRINRTAGDAGALGGGGDYVADDFTFTPVAAPEPSGTASFGLGLLTLLGFAAIRRHAVNRPPSGAS